MKLYEYTMLIDNGFDPETGEIYSDEFINELIAEREQKIEAIACYYKDVDKFENGAKEEIERLRAEIERCEKKKDWAKRYIQMNMDASEKINTVRCKVGFRSSKSVVIDNLEEIPTEFKRETVKVDAKKDDIKKAIESGVEVAGAHIQQNQNIYIK